MKIMNICVYGASSTAIDKSYIEVVEKLGKMLVEKGHKLFDYACDKLLDIFAEIADISY